MLAASSTVLDKQSATIHPADGPSDAIVRAAARRLALAWKDGRTPDRLVYSA